MPLTIRTIDFEASCLPRHGKSFPIEVAIAADGSARSWLIRPHESWAHWDWTAEAQALHGLSRARVFAEGLPVETVIAELAAAAGGGRIMSDSPIDQYWLDCLAQAAGRTSPFRIDHVAALFDESGAEAAQIAAAVARADSLGLVRHRAAADALWLGAVIDGLSEPAMRELVAAE